MNNTTGADFSLAAPGVLAAVALQVDDRSSASEASDGDSRQFAAATAVVEGFIRDRGLVLYGGQAIDYALRIRGAQIYPDYARPDLDFLSSDSVEDAYDLVERLAEQGFPRVVAAVAFHVQTMRVKTDFLYVADVTYVPRGLFERLPTVSFNGMRVLHPVLLRAQMHLSFCFPLANPPREDVFHRFGKTLRRLRLFDELYPEEPGVDWAFGALALEGSPLAPGRVTAALPPGAALHGFAAFAALVGAAALLGVSGVEAPELAVGADGVSLDSPDGALVLASPLAFDPPGGRRFAPFLDLRPEMVEVPLEGGGHLQVYSTARQQLAVWRSGDLDVVSPQYLLMDLLYRAFASPPGAARDLYREYYHRTYQVIELGGAALAKLDRGAEGSPAREKYDRLVACSPFGLPVGTLGDSNMSAAYLAKLGDSRRAVDGASAGSPKLPPLYAVDREQDLERRPRFDPDSNPHYALGGQLLPPSEK